MLSIIMIEFKAFFYQLRRSFGIFVVSCGLLSVCLAITLLFSAALEAIAKNSHFVLPSGAQVYTLLLAADANKQQQQLKPEAISYLRNLELEVLDNIIAVNHASLAIKFHDTAIDTQAEIVHLDGLHGIVPGMTRAELRSMEDNKSRVVILSETFARQLDRRFNSSASISPGSSLMIRGQLFKVLAIAADNFPGFNGADKQIDMWLPYHSLTFAKGLPQSVNLNGKFSFPGTHIYADSKQSGQHFDAEIFWLEQVLDSVGLLPGGTMLVTLKGVQENYHHYNNNQRLVMLNLFAGMVLLCLGTVNFFRFRLVQLNHNMDALTTRMALGQDRTMRAVVLLMQNIVLLSVVFLLALLLLMVTQGWALQQLELDHYMPDGVGLIRYVWLVLPAAVLLTQLQLTALSGQLNADLAASNAQAQHTSKTAQLLNILISATFFSSLLFLFMVLKNFLAFEQLPYGYVANHITVTTMAEKVNATSAEREYTPMALVRQTLQNSAAHQGMRIAFASNAPMDGSEIGQMSYFIPATLSNQQEKTPVPTNSVSGNFFELLGIAVKKGRLFTPNEHLHLVVNETFARRFLGQDFALPLTIYLDAQHPQSKEPIRIARHIVGVVADYFPASKKGVVEPLIFRHLDDQSQFNRIVLQHPDSLDDNGATQQLMKEIPLKIAKTTYRLKTRQQQDSAEERKRMTVFVIITLLNLLIFCVGVYAHLFQYMAGKKRELAIRYAIGASNGDIMKYSFTTAFWMFFPGSLLSLAGYAYITYAQPLWLNGLAPDIALLTGATAIFGGLIFCSSYLVYVNNKEETLCADIFGEQER